MNQPVEWHKGIGGGRFAFVQNAEGFGRKIVETASGVVLVSRCSPEGMPETGFTVSFDNVAEALASVTR